MIETLIEIKDLSKVYRANENYLQALDNVSFTIDSSEIFSLLGTNGAGKTTLSSILASLHPPTSGDIFFKGKSIYKDILSYRMAIGYCPQKPNLDPYLNVEQNLIFAGQYFLLPKNIIKERVEVLLDYFDLQKYKKSGVNILSRGYKQRLLLARSLIHNPKIVILDEPTVGLDPHIRRELWAKIKDLKSEGITVFITTHYLEEVEILSDRVCILDKGKVLLIDKPSNLKQIYQKGTLEDIFLQLISEEANSK